MCHFYIQCNLPFLEEQMSSLLSLFQFAFFFLTSITDSDQNLAKFYSEMFIIWGEGWEVALWVQKNFE